MLLLFFKDNVPPRQEFRKLDVSKNVVMPKMRFAMVFFHFFS